MVDKKPISSLQSFKLPVLSSSRQTSSKQANNKPDDQTHFYIFYYKTNYNTEYNEEPNTYFSSLSFFFFNHAICFGAMQLN